MCVVLPTALGVDVTRVERSRRAVAESSRGEQSRRAVAESSRGVQEAEAREQSKKLQTMPSPSLLLLVTLTKHVFANTQGTKQEVAQLSPAELAHRRHFWSIGDGFEGSASDWTEYVVWLVGVIGVFYYMSNPNARRNLHASYDDDNALQGKSGHLLNAQGDADDCLIQGKED